MYPVFNPYPAITPPISSQAQQTIQYVNGRSSAEAYQMPVNSNVLLMDSTQSRFYIKQTDASGIATIKTYEFKEVTADTDSKGFVTREEFEAFKATVHPSELPEGASALKEVTL